MHTDEESTRPLVTQRRQLSYHSMVSPSTGHLLAINKDLISLIRKLIHIINIILPEPLIKDEYLTRVDKTPVTPQVVRYVKKIAEEYNLEDAVVCVYQCCSCDDHLYCTLRTTTIFQREGARDETKYDVCKQKETIAEFLATELVHLFPDRVQLYLHVLTKRYAATLDTLDDDPTSAIEFALDHRMDRFISDPIVVQCVSALWDGSVLLAEERDDGSLTPATFESNFVVYKNWTSTNFWSHVDPVRLTVPKYQSLLELSLFAIFMGFYTVVVNQREKPLHMEIILYLFIYGYIFDDIRQLYKGGIFYLQQLWNWLNVIFVTVFVVAFWYRMLAITSKTATKEEKDQLNDTAFDLMATVAIILWMRILTMLDGFRFIGTMTVVLESMIKEGMLFFFMVRFRWNRCYKCIISAAWIFVGFVQTFYALSDEEHPSPVRIADLLARAFFQQPDFDKAEEYHPVIGKPLLMIYIFTSLTILLNLLIALFNDSYSKINGAAHTEYLKRFTYKVFHYLRAEDHYPFSVPFNLLEVFIIIPLGLVLTPRAYKRLNKAVLTVIFGGVLLVIGAYETWRVRNGTIRKLSVAGHIDEEVRVETEGVGVTEAEETEIRGAVEAGHRGDVVLAMIALKEEQEKLRAEIEELRKAHRV
ncbi:hypothetical protein BC936DRAFT_144856 [Jimgerdemannia flammicorona]|uniref:Uncharacterized protein n=1 Tax=Jimgerdemannia flammicorona TaxID=994334 RepID=A0A433DBI0_9FUNG|nr:hypothetical protein BC936DRAFT_144856 [Jimgerdemannia flammicorona]